MLAEALADSPGYSRMQAKAIEESGLSEVPIEAVLGMRRVFLQYRNRKSE